MHQTRAAAPADPETGRALDRPVHRFGAFELDSRAGELRKHGLRIRLQQQPLRLLEILLREPGSPVTREELRRELWRSDVHVDFDHSLNSAVNKLRDAGLLTVGAGDNVVRLLPPLIIEESHVEEALSILDKVCGAWAATRGAA